MDKAQQAKVLPILYDNSASEDEGTRQVVAECLGKLAIAHPADVVPTLQERIKDKSPHTRSTVLGAAKFALSVEKLQAVDKALQPILTTFLDGLKDSDLNVKRNAILVADAAIRYKPLLVKSTITPYLPLILAETAKRSELVRIVDLGMMKHEEDHGLETRKAAFELVNHLLDASVDCGKLTEFVTNQLAAALKDTNDVKLLAYATISKLAAIPSGADALRSGLDKFVDAFKDTVAKPVDPKKAEEALPDEIVRSGLVAIASLAQIPGPVSAKFDELVQSLAKGDLKDKYAAVQGIPLSKKVDLRSSKQ